MSCASPFRISQLPASSASQRSSPSISSPWRVTTVPASRRPPSSLASSTAVTPASWKRTACSRSHGTTTTPSPGSAICTPRLPRSTSFEPRRSSVPPPTYSTRVPPGMRVSERIRWKGISWSFLRRISSPLSRSDSRTSSRSQASDPVNRLPLPSSTVPYSRRAAGTAPGSGAENTTRSSSSHSSSTSASPGTSTTTSRREAPRLLPRASSSKRRPERSVSSARSALSTTSESRWPKRTPDRTSMGKSGSISFQLM